MQSCIIKGKSNVNNQNLWASTYITFQLEIPLDNQNRATQTLIF